MIRGQAVVAVEPRRVVVELSAQEFAAIDKASGHLGAADYLRVMALRLVAEVERSR